jgi:type VI secretion system protein
MAMQVNVMAGVAKTLPWRLWLPIWPRCLSTRAGSVQTLADYGLPDLNDMRLSLHDSLNRARFLIERFIEAYEPRLSNVRVYSRSQQDDLLRLSFCIEGLLEVEGLKQQVSFAANVDGNGQVKVSQ